MHAARFLIASTLCAAPACEGKDGHEHSEQHVENEAKHQEAMHHAEEECEALFAKVASCRDDMLMLARSGPVQDGTPPEIAFGAAKPLEKSLGDDLKSACTKGIPAGLAKGVECYDDDCRKLATCMLTKFTYPPVAEGDGALQCRDGLPAFEAKGQGKTMQWCAMADGTPHGLYRIIAADGTTIIEETHDRGKARTPPIGGRKWWD